MIDSSRNIRSTQKKRGTLSLEPGAWSNVLEKENRFTQTQAKTVKMSRDPHMDW